MPKTGISLQPILTILCCALHSEEIDVHEGESEQHNSNFYKYTRPALILSNQCQFWPPATPRYFRRGGKRAAAYALAQDEAVIHR